MPTTTPPKLPVWLNDPRIQQRTRGTQPLPSTTATVDTVSAAGSKADGGGEKRRWPKWQDLPEACNPSSVTPTAKIPLDDFVNNEKSGVAVVNTLEDLPSKYYTRERFAVDQYTRIPQYVPGGKESEQSTQLFNRFLEEAPNSEVLFCFPWGIGVDNTIAGPMGVPEKEAGSIIEKFSLFFNKFWYAKPNDIKSIANNKAEIIDVPGLVVQLSG